MSFANAGCCVLCSATEGGGLAVSGNGVTFTNVTASTFSDNSAGWVNASSSSGDGGALYLDGGATWLANNTFERNRAVGQGGAIAYMHECFQVATTPGETSAIRQEDSTLPLTLPHTHPPSLPHTPLTSCHPHAWSLLYRCYYPQHHVYQSCKQ